MIALIDPADPRLAVTPGEPLILATIQGLAKTAGPGLRREFWLSLDQGGCPAGAVCRTESGLWGTAGGDADREEAAAFLTALGELPGLVDGELAPLLPGSRERRPVLAYHGPMPAEQALAVPSVMGLVDCSIAAGEVPEAARGELYAELHLRIRRGVAQVFLVPDGAGQAVAGAANLLGQESAVVGYLACRRGCQGRGYGSAALAAAVRGALERGRRPLLACRGSLAPFYENRGFVLLGEVWEKSDCLSD